MILASNNRGKLREIKEILKEYELKTLSEVGIDIDVLEDQDSFYGNAYKKATEIYELTNMDTLSDDSGLCIEIFNGWPGVKTHRFLGDNATDKDRNLAILDKMKNIPFQDRKAKFICNLVYYNGIIDLVGAGILEGYIAFEEKGTNGMGFDKIFMLSDGRTLAELSFEEKNEISARKLAAIDLKSKMDVKKYEYK